jgi:hypothetical protein
MTSGNDLPDRPSVEKELIALLGRKRVRRVAMGNDAIWLAA